MFRRACEARSRASARRSADGTARAPASAGGSEPVRDGLDRLGEGERALRHGGREGAALGGVEEREASAAPRRRGAGRSRRGRPARRARVREAPRPRRSAASAPSARRARRSRLSAAHGDGGMGRGGLDLLVENALELDGAREILERGFAARAGRAARDVAAGLLRCVGVAPDREGEELDFGGVGVQAARHVFILLMHWLMRFHTAGTVHPESAAASASETLRTQYERMSRRQTGVRRRRRAAHVDGGQEAVGPVGFRECAAPSEVSSVRCRARCSTRSTQRLKNVLTR